MSVLAAFLVATLVVGASAWLTRSLADPRSRFQILDHPNERSLHSRPTPRTGGVAIVTSMLAGLALVAIAGEARAELPWLVAGVAILAGVSFLDDRRGLPVRIRLAGQFAAAAMLAGGGLVLPSVSLPGAEWAWPAGGGAVFSLLFLVWMANLYNFMDGMDGFAGGMGVVGFGTLALLGHLSGNTAVFAVNLVIAAAAGGFLLFNFPPARIFMGDTGSAVLGLLAGGMGLWGAHEGAYPFWAALLAFSPFIVDATVTLVRRLLQGKRVWEAHRTHYYQRLVQLGWGHRKTVLLEYLLMVACGASAVGAVGRPVEVQWAVIGCWGVGYATLALGVRALERRHHRQPR